MYKKINPPWRPSSGRALVLGTIIAGTLIHTTGAFAQTDLIPNLTPLPAFDLNVQQDLAGNTTLRLSTTSWNNGQGPLQLVAGDPAPGTGSIDVYQEIFADDGSSTLYWAGNFVYHADHGHIHFEDFALYSWQPVDAAGGSLETGSKVTFCVMDTDKIDTRLPGAAKHAVYTTCGDQIQGMSVGWGDTYGSHLPGQEIDITGSPAGIYQVKIKVDPDGHIIETDEADNESCVLVSYDPPFSLVTLDASGSCSAVLAITPDSAPMGGAVEVSITGYGLTDDLPIDFRGCNPRPVASNISLASDTDAIDMLTATVTVPLRRKLGRDTICDVHVGNSVLENAFSVTN